MGSLGNLRFCGAAGFLSVHEGRRGGERQRPEELFTPSSSS